jgi:hypothetical protein
MQSNISINGCMNLGASVAAELLNADVEVLLELKCLMSN